MHVRSTSSLWKCSENTRPERTELPGPGLFYGTIPGETPH